jgi:hypothetical protein
VSELSDTANAVLGSLRERPTLNTASLIATGPVGDRVDKPEIERALEELVAAGLVEHRPTGWKLAPAAG